MASYLLHGDFVSKAATLSISLALLSTAYTVYLTIYRLYFSPISHIPGPKLAAATWWYDFYFQVIKGGQMFKQVKKLHEQYGTTSHLNQHTNKQLIAQGPIIRIAPNEIHIDDPQFYDTIYTNTEKFDKAPWHPNAQTATTSGFATISHDLHRQRRATLNPYFSKAQIRKFTPWIQERVDILCQRLETEYKGKDKPLTDNKMSTSRRSSTSSTSSTSSMSSDSSCSTNSSIASTASSSNNFQPLPPSRPYLYALEKRIFRELNTASRGLIIACFQEYYSKNLS